MIDPETFIRNLAYCVKFSEADHPDRTAHAPAVCDAWIDSARRVLATIEGRSPAVMVKRVEVSTIIEPSELKD